MSICEMGDVDVFSKRRFSNLEIIGEGSFGVAYKSLLKRGRGSNATRSTVVIKIVKSGDVDDVWKEIHRMTDLDHPNILQLIGISTSGYNEAPWIVTEYMEYGDLLKYIWNYPGGSMNASVMIKIAYGIACGMEYLHHDVVQIHGDLAARNIFIGPEGAVKIGDFGRIDDTYEDHYYDTDGNSGCGNLPCPIRWMPPENVPGDANSEARFTRKGDVWAFGVVLYEIWTRGSLPYKDLDDDEVLDALEDGETPLDHNKVSARSYILELMKDCWEYERLDRPNFKYIKREFEINE